MPNTVVLFQLRPRPLYAREIWKRNNHQSFEICIWGKLGHERLNHVIRNVIIFLNLRLQNVKAGVFKFLRFEERFLKDASANCLCVSLLHTQSHKPRHASMRALIIKWAMIGKMAFAMALPGFNDLGIGRSAIPDFLSRNRFYLQLSPHCPKMNKMSMWEVKKIKDFCPRDIESCHLYLTPARRVKLCSSSPST